MIQRSEYLQQLIQWRDRQIIKVITGVRRCGKSTLFALYTEYLRNQGVAEEQIVSVNLEDLAFTKLQNFQVLYDYILQRLCPDRTTYVFLDEIQNCDGFEKVVDSLFLKPDVDIYITGSNAFMLSGELATLLSGRYVSIDMLPLSFKEYCNGVASQERSINDRFNDYLKFGSFPYLTKIGMEESLVRAYLEGIYNTILVKDVASRANIKNISLLERIVKCLVSSIGSPISAKKITDTLVSGGQKLSPNSTESYLRALTDSYIFYKADRYDIKGRQHLKTLGKYYMVDTGLRNLLVAGSSSDLGHLIENVVFLELLRRGNKVNIGKLAEKEVDFVASGGDGLMYYQVAATVLDETTLKRELESLQNIPDNHPKFLLTLDEIGAGANHDGIRQLNLVEWLMGS